MTLVIDGQLLDEPLQARAGAGEWVVASHGYPDGAVDAVAGLLPSPVTVTLDGTDLSSEPPVERHRAQLCTATCRLDQLPALRVADVIGLGIRAPQPPLWQALVGTARARALSADDEAHVRALAGRVGLASWVEATAVNLPLRVEALVDIARALAGVPKALVWRRPEWLDPSSLQEISDAVVAEQRLAAFAVVEFVAGRAVSLSPP